MIVALAVDVGAGRNESLDHLEMTDSAPPSAARRRCRAGRARSRRTRATAAAPTASRCPRSAARCSSGRSHSPPVMASLAGCSARSRPSSSRVAFDCRGDDPAVEAGGIDPHLERAPALEAVFLRDAALRLMQLCGWIARTQLGQPLTWRPSSASQCEGKREAPWAWDTFFLCARRPRLSGKKEGGISSMLEVGSTLHADRRSPARPAPSLTSHVPSSQSRYPTAAHGRLRGPRNAGFPCSIRLVRLRTFYSTGNPAANRRPWAKAPPCGILRYRQL